MKHIDPARLDCVALDSAIDLKRRRTLVMQPGSSLADMAAEAYPDLSEARRSILVATIDDHTVPQLHWRFVRPKVGAVVVFHPHLGNNDLLRTVLTIAVVAASVAAGQFGAPLLLGALEIGVTATSTAIASAVISASVLAGGALLINALVPPRPDKKDKQTYSIQGLQNQFTPDGVIPFILGRIRYAPPYAARPFTQSAGDDRYVVAAFCAGYGQLTANDWCIGTTSLDRFTDVQFEWRPGVAGDAPLSLYRKQVLEEPLSITLNKDSAPDGTPIPTGGPQTRTTSLDVSACSVDVSFPGGVFQVDEDGAYDPWTVNIATFYRKVGDSAYTAGPMISATADRPKAFTRTTTITFPDRGRYEVQLKRLTEDWDEADQSGNDTKKSGRSVWTALRGIRPEYPLNVDVPLALAACRIRATGQLNGTLDALNAEFCTVCADWDKASQTWIRRETNNPAALFRYVLQSAAMTYPLLNSQIDLDALQDWHSFCAAKSLSFNRVIDYEASVAEVLADIAAAGRASPQDSGTKWGVAVDRALTLVSAHISPRNSWGFSGDRTYAVFPDAFRVRFLDATNRYQPAERIVPWPGFSGTPSVVEKLEMPGVTDPAMVWREARRRQYELMLRPELLTVNQEREALVVTRGDRVQLSHDVLDRVQVAARVKAVDGSLVTLDEAVTMVAGQSYGFRFRADDGTSVVRTVQTVAGEMRLLRLTGTGMAPSEGNLLFFGLASLESLACTVRGIEAMDNFCARLTLVAHAPEIEAQVDAEVPPIWSGRAGGPAQGGTEAPMVPVIIRTISGQRAKSYVASGNPYPVVVLLKAGAGGTQPPAQFEVRSRKVGASAWNTTVIANASDGAVVLANYAAADKGTPIEMQADAVGDDGTRSAWTASYTHTLGASDPAALTAPTALSLTMPASDAIRISVSSSADKRAVATQLYMATGAAASFASAVKIGGPIYSGPNAALVSNLTGLAPGTYRIWATALDNRATPNESAPLGPVDQLISGPELFSNGTFDSDTAWTKGAGWTIGSGAASKATNAASGMISQAVALTAGKVYRITVQVTAISGTVTPRLTGGTTVNASNISTTGTFTFDLTAASGNNGAAFFGPAASTVTIDNVSLKQVG